LEATVTVSMRTLHGDRTDIDEDVLDHFREQLRGPVVRAPMPAPETHEVFNAMWAGHPEMVAQCSGTADVLDAVNFARSRDLVVAVRGGGHSIAGLSTIDDGLLIDLSEMDGVQVDPDRRLAYVQGGALWGDVDRDTQAFGLATPGGVVSDTGVAGLTLGGGYGWLRRRYGLSCDNLVRAQVVCADGQVRTASEDQHPDLFWALRGGGGNFGIVTSFTFRLHEVGPNVAFAGVFYPLEELSTVMTGWREYLTTVPDEVTSVIVTITFPELPGMPPVLYDRQCAFVASVYSGDLEEGLRALQPVRELGTPLFDMSGPMPYTAVQTAFDPLFPRNTLRAYWKSAYLDKLSDAAIDTIVDRAQHRPAPRVLVNTFHMGGAINAVGPTETAFAERSADFMVSIDGMWMDPAGDAAVIDWVRSAWDDVSRHGTGSVYLNFTGLADESTAAGVPEALGQNLRRLAEVKAAYDPDNFFRVNNNIRPAS
jgi:FAD/FMN-containing dehydrogenase